MTEELFAVLSFQLGAHACVLLFRDFSSLSIVRIMLVKINHCSFCCSSLSLYRVRPPIQTSSNAELNNMSTERLRTIVVSLMWFENVAMISRSLEEGDNCRFKPENLDKTERKALTNDSLLEQSVVSVDAVMETFRTYSSSTQGSS